MADDSMEISSDHGQNTSDYIDIDIDLTAGQVDEDYILQDAQSDADYGNEFPPEPSPMHHDEPMIDDDSASYQMDDADLIHGEGEQYAEPESMSFAPSNDIYTEGGDRDAEEAITYSEDHDVGTFFDEHGDHEPEATNGDVVLESEHISDFTPITEGLLPNEATVPADDPTTLRTEEPKNEDSQHESLGSTPRSRSPAAAPEEPRSPRALIPTPGPTSPVESIPTSSHPTQDIHHEADQTEEIRYADNTYDSLKAPDVKVVYQSVEYALFSTSELDDPDSFFLSDHTIVEKPLDQFFLAIREIIRDDLNAEDELCLTVEDLGLETEEASSSLGNVTLAHILSLRHKLLQNDGVNSPGPLYLLLGTRVNFSKRFTNLVGGASLGKGMSELVVWEENSESLDGSGERDEATNGVQSILETRLTTEVAEGTDTQAVLDEQKVNSSSAEFQVNSLEVYEEEEYTENQEKKPQGTPEYKEDEVRPNPDNEAEHRDVQDENAQPEEEYRDEKEEQYTARVEEESAEDLGEVGESELGRPTTAVTDHSDNSDPANVGPKSLSGTQESTNKHSGPAKLLSELRKETVNSVDNGEDDLIDYSDEELQDPDEGAARPAAILVGEHRTNHEYQAKDEELRRRSLSRQAEGKLLEQSLDQAYTEANEETYAKGYNEEDTTGYEYANDFQYDDQSDNYELVEHTGDASTADHEDPNGLSNDHETFEHDNLTYEHGPDIGAEGYDGVGDDDYPGFVDSGDEGARSDGLPTSTAKAVSQDAPEFVEANDKNGHEPLAPSIASSHGAEETAESSVTLGAEEIQYGDDLDEEISQGLEELEDTFTPRNISLPEEKDEIDYEDDEDEETPILAGPEVVFATKEPSNSNRKRSISDVESVTSISSKDAKRPRS